MEHVIVYLYDESGAPIGMQYRTSEYAWREFDNYFFEKNLFGDIVAIYNEAGNKIGSYKYDAWGACTMSVESTASTLEKKVVRTLNPFRYRGYYFDTETGFYYLQSRYYNPQWGRFLNADGYINANGDLIGFNMYAYCSNNPVMYTDPTGESAILTAILIGCAIGAVIGGVIGGTVAYNSAKDSGAEGAELILDTAVGVSRGITIGLIAGGIIGASWGVLGVYGAGSVAGTAVLSTVPTIFGRGLEVMDLQYRKSRNENKGLSVSANDCLNAMFFNAGQIIGIGSCFKASTMILRCHFSSNYLSTLGTSNTLGPGSYLLTTIELLRICESFESRDPLERASERGYILQ